MANFIGGFVVGASSAVESRLLICSHRGNEVESSRTGFRLLLRKWDWRKRSPSRRPSPPGEGEARTLPGIFTPFGVEYLHGNSRRRLRGEGPRGRSPTELGCERKIS